MKSYTDLEQSKKLAEFLPLESADMIWVLANPDLPMIRAIAYEDSEKSKYYEILPAWSLATLLSVIKPVKENTYKLTGTLDGGAFISFEEVTNVMYQEEEIIDAVYEMVLWLHEKGVL